MERSENNHEENNFDISFSNTEEQSLNGNSQNRTENESASTSVLGQSPIENLNRSSSEQNVASENGIERPRYFATWPRSRRNTANKFTETDKKKQDDEYIKPIGYHHPVLINSHYYPLHYNELEQEDKDIFSSHKGQTCITPEGGLLFSLCLMIFVVNGCFLSYYMSSENNVFYTDILFFGGCSLVLTIWFTFRKQFTQAQYFPETNPKKFTYYEELYMP